MFETAAELSGLQEILDTSYAGASDQLRGIINDGRTLRATEITGLMSGMRTLSLATVTSRGEPRVSAVDGHFLHAQWIFSTSVTSAKAKQLKARPAVSSSYVEGEELAVFAHGSAYRIAEDDATFEATLAYLTDHYGSSPLSWGDTALYRVRPSWMVGYAAQRESLLASRGVEHEPRDEHVS
jgi:general stress protein 26